MNLSDHPEFDATVDEATTYLTYNVTDRLSTLADDLAAGMDAIRTRHGLSYDCCDGHRAAARAANRRAVIDAMGIALNEGLIS